MTVGAKGWRLALLAITSMLMMLVAPAFSVSAQADAATEFATVVGQRATMTPIAGPLSGSLDAANAGSAPAGVSVTNGLAHAEFTVPAVNTGTLWAMAVLFRVSDSAQNFLLIFPDGTWQLDNGQGAAVNGSGATFDTTPGTTVAVDVLFDGATGAFGLNGTFVSALDLTAVQSAGDVELTGYLGLGAGATTLDYSNFLVYDLSGGTAAPTATGGDIGVPTATGGAVAPTATSGAVAPTATGGDIGAPTAVTGDPASIFAQYLATAASQPKLFGPTSGVMIHDPERVTFQPSNVTVSDFGAHIECAAPRPADQLWDCGLAFRDTQSPNHYRLGVVSDGQWFLSIGSQSSIQKGGGLTIGPNVGDVVSLDLFVVGAKGYFGVNGTFVAELDLSQIPGPGSVDAVIGFFSETYIAGGQTPYQNFYVIGLDQGTAPSPTTVVGPPTEAPTVAPPPVETPTVAPPPVETPTTVIGVPTETAAAGTSNVSGSTYTSPTFGYQISWDPTWSVVTDSSQNGFDVLRLTNGTVVTDLYSGASSMGLEQCVTSLVEYYQGNTSYSNIVQQSFANGQQILTQDNVAIATLTFDFTDDTGASTPTTDSVICVAMPAQGALLTMESYIPTADVATQQAAVSALEAALVVDGAPIVLPQVPSSGVATEAPVVPTQAGPPAAETPAVAPTVPTSGSATFFLTSTGGSAVSGFGQISGQARTINLTAITTNAEVGSTVGIAHGSCVDLASVLEPDYFVGETNETGIVQGSVPVSLSVLLTRGPYSVVVYGPGDSTPMVACGEITGA